MQIQICFLTKRKIENLPIYGQAYIYMVCYFVKKGSLQKNGITAFPKRQNEFFFEDIRFASTSKETLTEILVGGRKLQLRYRFLYHIKIC